MYASASRIDRENQIVLTNEVMELMGLEPNDEVAMIYQDNRVTLIKVTEGLEQMTYDEFLNYRKVKIKNKDHDRVIRFLYRYAESVTGNPRLLPEILGQAINVDTSNLTVPTGCANGVNDGTNEPYINTDFYVRFSDNSKLFIYGSLFSELNVQLEGNQYVLFILAKDENSDFEVNTLPNRYSIIMVWQAFYSSDM